MTQRVDLATVMDRLAINDVVSAYAVAIDDSEWTGFRSLFTPDGRADYTGAGGIEGTAAEIADWLAGTLRLAVVRQHLIINRRARIEDLDGSSGDNAEMAADYLTTLRPASGPDLLCGGRFSFRLRRVEAAWQVHTVSVQEKWRRSTGTSPLPPGGPPAVG
jgi:SnoaL-like protein